MALKVEGPIDNGTPRRIWKVENSDDRWPVNIHFAFRWPFSINYANLVSANKYLQISTENDLQINLNNLYDFDRIRIKYISIDSSLKALF